MRFLGDLGVKLDEPVLLAVLTDISAPTMGEMTRSGFVEGWKLHQLVPLRTPPFSFRAHLHNAFLVMQRFFTDTPL